MTTRLARLTAEYASAQQKFKQRLTKVAFQSVALFCFEDFLLKLVFRKANQSPYFIG